MSGSFKATVYFSVVLPLLYKGRFHIDKVGAASILKADTVVCEDLTVDYSLFGVFGIIDSFVDISVVVHRLFVISGLLGDISDMDHSI